MLIFGCGCSSPFISYQLVVNIMNTIFVKRGRPALKTVVYTEDLLSKKERKKKKKKKKRLMEESSICTAPPWLVH